MKTVNTNRTDQTNDTSDGTMLAFAIPQAGDKHGEVMRIPIPEPEANFALVRVYFAGVCNTDIEILQGYMGFHGVLGHEFVGRVVQMNTEDKELEEKFLNKRVCGDINVGCQLQTCNVCTNATCLDHCGCPKMSRNHCPNRSVLGILNKNGTMAEYLTLPIINLHLVPESMLDQVAVFSEPLAAAFRIVEQGLIYYGNEKGVIDPASSVATGRAPDKVAILGDGKLGLMIAEVLGREHLSHFYNEGSNNNGKEPQRPILFGKHKQKLDLVQESGVKCLHVSECQDDNAYNGVAAEHAGQYDVVVDATGSPAGLSLAAGLCRPMGTLVLKSTCAAGEKFNAAPFVIDELRVVGSRCGPIDRALELLNLREDEVKGQFPLRVEKYITRVFPLTEADKAIQCASEKSTMKVLINCSSNSN